MVFETDEIEFLEKECEALFYETWDEIKEEILFSSKEEIAREMFKVGFILALQQAKNNNEDFFEEDFL